MEKGRRQEGWPVIEMVVEGIATQRPAVEDPARASTLLVLRERGSSRRICLPLCAQHAARLQALMAGQTPAGVRCGRSSVGITGEAISALVTYGGRGPAGPRIRFGLTLRYGLLKLQKRTCATGALNTAVWLRLPVLVDERVLEQGGPMQEPRWLVRADGEPTLLEGPVGEFVRSLASLDDL